MCGHIFFEWPHGYPDASEVNFLKHRELAVLLEPEQHTLPQDYGRLCMNERDINRPPSSTVCREQSDDGDFPFDRPVRLITKVPIIAPIFVSEERYCEGEWVGPSKPFHQGRCERQFMVGRGE